MGIAKKHTDVSLDTSLFCLKHPAWCWNHFSAVRRWESSCRNRHIRCVVRRNPSPLSGNMAWCCWPWCQGWGFWGLKVEPLAAGEFWSWDMRIGTNCVSRVVGYFICIQHGIVWHWELHDASWSCCRTCASPFYVMCAQFKHSRSEVSPSSKMLGHSTPGSKTLRETHRWTFRSITWQVNTLSWLNGKVWHWITFHEGTSLDNKTNL